MPVGSGNGQGVHRGGAGEPLVLIHGFSGTRLMWEPVLEALERSHDVLAVNLAGHVGGPELANTPPSVNALVDAVERELDAAGFDTAHMIGNSLGGWIALELAARGRARSVVAVAPAGGWEQGSRAERRLRTLFTRNHKLSTALLPRIDSLMRRPRLRCALPEGIPRSFVAIGSRCDEEVAPGTLCAQAVVLANAYGDSGVIPVRPRPDRNGCRLAYLLICHSSCSRACSSGSSRLGRGGPAGGCLPGVWSRDLSEDIIVARAQHVMLVRSGVRACLVLAFWSA